MEVLEKVAKSVTEGLQRLEACTPVPFDKLLGDCEEQVSTSTTEEVMSRRSCCCCEALHKTPLVFFTGAEVDEK